ncbi:MAG: hypothetical protein LQ343_006136 [Gyalolechia ehrenbergii]|nr:MAG: hypothetical protein LQ343_006136 [Gyalolechia ehrenbergii]
MRQTLQIPDVRSLRYDSRRIIVDFVGSLFHPATYWSIRECAHSVTANTGLRTEDRSATDRQNKVKVEGKRPNGVLERCTISQGTARGVLSSGTERRTGDHTGRQRETYQTSEPSGQTDNGEYTMPSCVSDYVKAWTQYQRWSSQTARPQLTTMMTMSLEGELYVYWCRVARVWVEVFEEIYGYRVAEGDGVPDDTAGTRSANAGLLNDAEVKIAHEEKESLRKFFYKELGKRGYVTGLGPRFPIGRPMHLLRQMIAPYIGFPSLLGPQVEVSRQEDRDCIYEKLWYRQIRGGKVNYMVMRSLGWGALAVMKRGHIKTIGPRILPLILPIIRERHPELPEIFEILFCAFVQPVRSGHPLIFHEVGHFMSIPSRNALIAACKNQADGLRGIFELGRRPIQSLSEATIVESTMNDDDAFNVADLLQRELANDKAEAEEHVRLRGMKRPASVTPNGDTERRMGRRTRYRMSPTRQSSV